MRISFSMLLFTLLLVVTQPVPVAYALEEPLICPDIAAAEEGSPLDTYYMGRAYHHGYCGITQDIDLAITWYERAASADHMLAQYHLGEIYFTGSQKIPDYPKAKAWYQKAALQGHGESQLRLGFLYAENHFDGLTTDYEKAEYWFLKAAEQDAGDARFRLGNFYRNYKQPPDYQKAYDWLLQAAKGGHRVAMYDLGIMLLNGNGVEKNVHDGLIWIEKAAAKNLLHAQMTLSKLYETGSDVEKNMFKSLKWTLAIAMQPTASVFWINKAGDIFFEGRDGIPQNYPQAARFYTRAADKNDPHAQSRLGQMYLNGWGVEKNRQKALQLLERAAQNGNAEAKELLAPAK